MSNSEDRRITRTKQLLKKSLIDLLKEKNISEISVKEITTFADVNRGTFYLHYQDIYDMVDKIEKEIYRELESFIEYRPSEEIDNRILRIYEEIYTYVAENSALCTVLLGEHANMTFLEQLKTILKDKVLASWEELLNINKNYYFEAYSTFIIGGYVNLIQEWLKDGLVESPEYMARLSYEITMNGATFIKNGSVLIDNFN